jgi:hypothetical protein
METKTALLFITGLIASSIAGYSLGYVTCHLSLHNVFSDLVNKTNEIANLTSTVRELQADKAYLETKLNDLQQPKLYIITIKDNYTEIPTGADTHQIDGIIHNCGKKTATNVTIHIEWYDGRTLIHEEALAVRDLTGTESVRFEAIFYFEGGPYTVTARATWT